jgi:death-on-curing protein
MDEPVWVREELVEAILERQLAEHGGTQGLRDDGLSQSALARQRQLFAYGGADLDVPALAASLAYGLARNHPFVDGNKRTCAVACELFLELNGYVLVARDEELYPVFLGLAAGEWSEQELADWLRAHARPESVNEAAGVWSSP